MNRHSLRSMSYSVLLHVVALLVCALAMRPGGQRELDVERPVDVAVVVVRNGSSRYLHFENTIAVRPASDFMAAPSSESAPTFPFASLPDLPVETPRSPPVTDIVAVRPAAPPSARINSSEDYGEFVEREAAELRARQPKGMPAALSLFGGPASRGRSFVFVIDRSKSMGGGGLNALEAAAEELARALESLKPVHRFTVIAYHHQVVYLDGRRLVPADDAHRQRVEDFVKGLAAYGQTDHLLGLQAAFALDPDVIYLLTDGGDPELTDIQLQLIHRDAAAQGAAIHCIQFGSGPLRDENPFLRRLAYENRGSFTYIDMLAYGR